MNELQKTSTKKVEKAKQAVSSIQGFEMTEFENGKRDLTFNEYLIVNHYESKKRQGEEMMQILIEKINEVSSILKDGIILKSEVNVND